MKAWGLEAYTRRDRPSRRLRIWCQGNNRLRKRRRRPGAGEGQVLEQVTGNQASAELGDIV